jgi:hypothetical protein
VRPEARRTAATDACLFVEGEKQRGGGGAQGGSLHFRGRDTLHLRASYTNKYACVAHHLLSG